MANDFATRQKLAKRAGLMVKDNFKLGNLVNRTYEDTLSPGSGRSVDVVIPNAFTGELLDIGSDATAEDFSDSTVKLEISKRCTARAALTSAEEKYDVDDQEKFILEPMLQGVISQAEEHTANKIVRGFSRNAVGTLGNEISSYSDTLAGVKKHYVNTKSNLAKAGILTPESYYNLLDNDKFVNSDFGEERPEAIRTGILADALNTEFHSSVNLGDFNRGDVSGTIKLDGAHSEGDTKVSLSGFSSSTGTIYKGTKFDIGGGDVFTVAETVEYDSSTATVTIYDGLDQDYSDDTTVNFQTAHKENVIYTPRAVAAAFLPSAMEGGNATTINIDGFGITYIESDKSTANASKELLLAMDIAVEVSADKFGVITNGS